MATLGDILETVPALLDDTNLAVFTPEFILPYVNTAQRTLVQRLRAVGVDEIKFRASTITVPANTTVLSTTTTPALPSDIIVPDEIFEAKVGGSQEDFFRVVGPTTIPSQASATTLGYWDWYGGQLHFLGATEARLIRLDYWGDASVYTSPADPASVIVILGAVNAISFLCAYHIAKARGQYEAAMSFKADAEAEIEDLIRIQDKAKQQQPERRQPYRGRGRYQGYYRGAY